MNILNKLLHYFFWGVFFLVITVVAFKFSFNIVPDINKNIFQNGIGAFFGAFFAFVFLRLSDWVSLKRKENISHFNSLVMIERHLNRVISCLEKNILNFQGNIEALESMKLLTWSSHTIPYNFELADELKNIDFVNDYFTFTLDLETMNNDFNTMKSMYDEVKGLFIDRKISPDVYQDNVAFCVNRMREISKFIHSYQEKAIQLTAKARILQKENKNWSFLFGAFPKRHYGKNFEKELEKEKDILNEEIETVSKKSQEEIDKIKENIVQPDTKKPSSNASESHRS